MSAATPPGLLAARERIAAAICPPCTNNCAQGRQCAALGRQWWMEFELDGRPMIWTGTADNESAAESLARAELDRKGLTRGARLVACIEK